MRLLGAIFAAAFVLLAPLAVRAQERPWFGAAVESVTKEMKAAKGLTVSYGARVTGVEEDSPAAQAGLAEGDVIITVNGEPVKDAPAFAAALGKLAVGAAVEIERVRGKEAPSGLTATLAEAPQPAEARPVGRSPRLMLDTGGHMGLIKDLTFTPDGKFIVSAGQDKTIRVWDWRAATSYLTRK